MAPVSFSQLIGRNVQRIREGIPTSQSGVSRALTTLGVRWPPSRVSQLEAGEVAATLSTALILAAALSRLANSPITVADLLRTDSRDELVELAVGLYAPGGLLTEILAGGCPASDLYEARLTELPSDGEVDSDLFPLPNPRVAGLSKEEAQAVLQWNRVDERAARSLGLQRLELIRLAVRVWGRGFSEERDRRASTEGRATQAEMTSLTRTLRKELATAIGDEPNIRGKLPKE